jgi:uncharacterized protein (DUF1778 family)
MVESIACSGNWPYTCLVSTRKRSGRIEARVTVHEKRLFERAAALEGRTLTDFLLASAREVAERTIGRHESYRLTPEDQRVFVDALLNPPAPNRALRTVMRRHRIAQSRG